jgi:hypothetical protein
MVDSEGDIIGVASIALTMSLSLVGGFGIDLDGHKWKA